jgi:DHA2 family multidrug resistance protein
MKRVDVRLLAFIGIAIFAISCFMNVALSADNAGDQFFIPNIVRAIGQSLVITPVTAITTALIAPADAAAASGLTNMLRNLGGAVGTASLGTILTKREQFHSNIIGQSVTLARGEVRQRIDQMTGYFMSHGVSDRALAQKDAVVALGQTVKKQALIMGFGDTFAVIGVVLSIAAVSVLFTKKAVRGGGAGAH